MRTLLVSWLVVLALVGCAGLQKKSQGGGGDPTCPADGSFEADYYGCTGTPNTQAAAPKPGCKDRGYKTSDRNECCSDMLASRDGDLFCCNYDSGKGFCDLDGPE